MKIDKSKFKSNKELHDFIVKNMDAIVSAKKAEVKHSKGVPASLIISTEVQKGSAQINKAELDDNVIVVDAIINTTNMVDSHQDLHVPGMWNKSLLENNRRKHLQEHKTAFENVISSGQDLEAFVKDTTFSELGVKGMVGNTQALVYRSTVRKDRNPFMFNQYKNGWVEEHSVGMQYVKISTAINDEEYKDEFSNWNTYYNQISNKEVVDKDGYFFIIHEAKEIEGSAVPFGSNYATPTFSVENQKEQPLGTPLNEPPASTQEKDFFQGW